MWYLILIRSKMAMCWYELVLLMCNYLVMWVRALWIRSSLVITCLINTFLNFFFLTLFPLCSLYFSMANTSGSYLVATVDGLLPLASVQSPEVSCIISAIDPHCSTYRPHQNQGGISWNVSWNITLSRLEHCQKNQCIYQKKTTGL